MDLAVTRPMTLEAFLAWEEAQDEKYEFDGEQAILMTGGTLGHSVITSNILLALHPQLRGRGLRVYLMNVKVTPPGRSRYPDVIVSATPLVLTETIEREPIVLFEILSPGTRRTDLVAKNAEYRTVPTLQRYVTLEQDAAVALSVSRADRSRWVEQRMEGLDAVLGLPEIGATLRLIDAYEGVLTA